MNVPPALFSLLLLLLIWTPFAFGSVHAISYSMLELHAFFLVGLGMVQVLLRRRAGPGFVWTPMAIPLGLFLALLAGQLLPLPPGILRLLSPATEELYRLFVPDWPNTWMPLSLNQYATQIALVKLLAYTGVFFWVVNTVHTQRQIRMVCWVIVAVATGMAILGMAQKYTGIHVIHLFRDAALIGNPFGPYVNGNHFAAYEAMAVLLGLGLLLSYQPLDRAAAEELPSPSRQVARALWIPRLLLVVCLFTMVSALVMSRSRGGFLAFLCGLVAFALLMRFRPRNQPRRRGFAVVVVAMACVLLWFGSPLLIRFVHLATGNEALPWAGRLSVFQATWTMAKDFPLFGVGYEAYASIFPRYQLPQPCMSPIRMPIMTCCNCWLKWVGWAGRWWWPGLSGVWGMWYGVGGSDAMLTLCERVATLAPAYPQLQFALGDILLYTQAKKTGKHDALPFFRRAAHLNEHYESLVWKAYQRALPEAEALQNFAWTMPNTAQGHLRTARVLQDTHWPQARLHYRAAMTMDRSNPDHLRAYADALMHHQDFEQAQHLWSRYIGLAPAQVDDYLQLASAARASKDDAGEVQALEQLVTRFPRQAKFEEQLAQTYLRLGKTEEAEAAWQRVVALQPNSQSAYTNLARLYEQNDERAKALQAYLKLTRLRPDDANLMFKVGEHYRQDGKVLDALRYYRRAVDLKPNHAGFRQALEKALQMRIQ